MITKAKAVKMSIEKWEAIVDGAEEDEDVSCGFCFYREQTVGSCRDCPLSAAGLCALPDGVYQQWELEGTKKLAQKMLDGIKKHGAKWIAGGG